MPKPIILITAGRMNRPTAINEIQDVWTGCDIDYVNSIIRAGGAPVLLPRIGDAEAVEAAVDAAAGLLLTGGGDICSLEYGEEPHPTLGLQDPIRDSMELLATRHAQERGIPILGICRGLQLLNVAAGGTLIQDVKSQVPNVLQHYTYSLEPVFGHSIEIEPGSLLHEVMRVARTNVNSYHHQAVKDVGRGLKVVARAADGVVEAIEASDGRPVLAVQFHPEESTRDFPTFRPLFEWLVHEASKPAVPWPESLVS